MAVHFLLPPGSLAQGLLFVAIHLSAVVALIVGIRRHRPRARHLWWLLVAGELVYLVANGVWFPYVVAFDVTLPYPSAADALYIGAYLAVLGAIGSLVWRRSRSRTALLDAAIVVAGLGGLSWEFLIEPVLEGAGTGALAKAVTIFYPLIDLLLLGAVTLIAFTARRRDTAYGLLAAGLLLNLSADTAYVQASLDGTFTFGAPYFAGWLAFYVLLGAAALDPSMRAIGEPAPEREEKVSSYRIAFLAAAAFVTPLTVTIQEIRDPRSHVFLTVLSAALFGLVLLRVGLLVRDVAAQQRLDKAKSEFISVVSHELRTPLTSIRGALGLLARGTLGTLEPKGQRMLEIASVNTDRLVRLINDILDIERLESGKAPLQLQECDAAHLVRQAVETMRAMADAAGVELRAEAGPSAVSADPDRVVQTLDNLINNAVKFSPRGSTVTVASERRDGEVVFSVADRGRGIPPEKLETIFGRFQQVDASDSRQKGGTGLGLAICRSIVTQHGGRIWVESTPGEGSTFLFTIPALPERSRPPSPAGDGQEDRGATVLVCDDDREVLEVVAAMLERRGYSVVQAVGGAAAVELARSRRPDAVLLDLIMPGMSGWDTIAALKQHPATAGLPVVALTVLGGDEARRDQAPVSGWVTKPIEERELFAALHRALTGRTGGTRVLVVEDDVGLAQVLTAMFELHGLEAYHAQTLRQAIDVSDRMVPQLLVLDMTLPDGDGTELVRRFREDDRLCEVPVVVYTARDISDRERQAVGLGDAQVFTKAQVTPAELEQRVADLIDEMVIGRRREEVSAWPSGS